MLSWGAFNKPSKITSIVRLFAQEPYSMATMDTIKHRDYLCLPPETSVWLWKNRTKIFYGQDTSGLFKICLGTLVWGLSDRRHRSSAVRYLEDEYANEFRTSLMEGSLEFLECLFTEIVHTNTVDGYEIGATFLCLIRKFGVDVDACISKVLEPQAGKLFSHYTMRVSIPDRRQVVEHVTDSGWKLGWEWVYEKEQPGYLLVSQYSSLAADALYPW
jgi:hypothetical protein